MNLSIRNVNLTKNKGKVKALFTIAISHKKEDKKADFYLTSMKLIKGDRGYFIAPPCYEDGEGEYKDIVLLSKRARDWALKEVLSKYEEKKKHQEEPQAADAKGKVDDEEWPFD